MTLTRTMISRARKYRQPLAAPLSRTAITCYANRTRSNDHNAWPLRSGGVRTGRYRGSCLCDWCRRRLSTWRLRRYCTVIMPQLHLCFFFPAAVSIRVDTNTCACSGFRLRVHVEVLYAGEDICSCDGCKDLSLRDWPVKSGSLRSAVESNWN